LIYFYLIFFLQQHVETQKKVEFVNKLSQTGLKRIEVTSFVSPKWIPQLADAKQVMKQISRNSSVRYSTLTPNIKGYNDAIESGTQEVAIFGAASETFTKKNINCTIEKSLQLFDEVVKQAKLAKLPIRGYVSCVVGCPYEGFIKPSTVCNVVEKMLAMGCYEISLGDTIGVGKLFLSLKGCSLLPYSIFLFVMWEFITQYRQSENHKQLAARA
jgi:hydroxymethylglutaryl-CoA lyase